MIINTYLIHHSKVPEAILIQTLEKGTESLAMRRKAEYHLFTRSELEFMSEFSLNLHLISDMGANPKSAQGTAFAFSRPNKEALLLSNTSLLLEYTSRVFLDSLQE